MGNYRKLFRGFAKINIGFKTSTYNVKLIFHKLQHLKSTGMNLCAPTMIRAKTPSW